MAQDEEIPAPTAKAKRLTIGKKLRFEVFKRDSFKCQYCGDEAPNVLLHVDHIKPVSDEGTNDLLNLITSCEACNLGKGARALGDNTVAVKQRAQLEVLQERQEQLEMMMEWQRGLRGLKHQAIDQLAKYWQELAPGFDVSEAGKKKIAQWLRNFSLAEITEAMNIAAEQYLRQPQGEQSVTSESWIEAFHKVPGICRVTKSSVDDPDLRDLLYIRGILSNRLNYMKPTDALDWLRAARSWEIPMDDLKHVARTVSSWNRFVDEVHALIQERKAELGYTPE